MQREAKILVLYPQGFQGVHFLAEGKKTFLPPSDPTLPDFGLEKSLKAAGWERSSIILLLPSQEVSLHKLYFSFTSQKHIKQALHFALKDQILEPLDKFLIKKSIVPRSNKAGSDVWVKLIRKELQEKIKASLDKQNLSVGRVTFLGEVLEKTLFQKDALHYRLYAGEDEVCLMALEKGYLAAMKHFQVPLKGKKGSLAWVKKEKEPVLEEESFYQPNPELKQTLLGLCEQVNHFLRPHAQGRPYSVSLLGEFAPFLQWSSGDMQVVEERRFLPEESINSSRGMLGVLLELPNIFSYARNFHFPKDWGSIKKLLIRSLAGPGTFWKISGMGLILLALLFLNFGFQLENIKRETQLLKEDVNRVIARVLKENHAQEEGLRLLYEKLSKKKILWKRNWNLGITTTTCCTCFKVQQRLLEALQEVP